MAEAEGRGERALTFRYEEAVVSTRIAEGREREETQETFVRLS